MTACLVVEDSETIREITVRIVRDLGLAAHEAENAFEAVECCRGSDLDIVLLDWDLPSLGALDFLRGAANLDEDRRPTIILCATENDPQQFALAKAAGAAHHLLKPYDRMSLAQVLIQAGFGDALDPQIVENAKNLDERSARALRSSGD